MSAWEADGSTFTAMHGVADDNCAYILMAIAMHEGVDLPVHLSWRLISNHFSKDGGADGAPDPIFISFKCIEASFVQEMTAGQSYDIII